MKFWHAHAQTLIKALTLVVIAYCAASSAAHADEHLVFRPFIAGEGILRPGSGERMQIYAKYNPQVCFEWWNSDGPGSYRFKLQKCDANNRKQYFIFDYSNKYPGTILIKLDDDGPFLTDNTRGLQAFGLTNNPETPDGGAWKAGKTQGEGSGFVIFDLTASIKVTLPDFSAKYTNWQHVEIDCNGKKFANNPDNKFPVERLDSCTDVEFYFAEKGKRECFDGAGGTGEGYNIGIDHCNGGGNQQWGVRHVDARRNSPAVWNAARAFFIKPKKQNDSCVTQLPDGSAKLRACSKVNINEQMYVLNEGRIINTTPGKECLWADFRSSACAAKNPLASSATMSVEALTGAGWKITDQGLLRNKYGECLTASGDSVVKASCGNREEQLWNITNASDSDVNALKSVRSNAAATTLLAPLPSDTPPSTSGTRGALRLPTKVNADYCVDMANGVAGAAIVYFCHGGLSQQMLVNYAAPDTLAVADQQGKAMCLTANGAKKPLSFGACNGSAQQIWVVSGNNDAVTLRNPEINQCVDLAGGNAAAGTLLYAWDCHGRDNQQWGATRLMSYVADTVRAPTPPPAAATSFANIKLQTNHPAPGAMCIDIDRANDKSPVLWQCHGEANQRFTIDTAKSVVRYKDRCMTMVALPAAQSEGGQLAAIAFNACDNSVAQRWTATAQGQLKHDSGRCADIAKMRNDNGAPIGAWPCHGGTNQSWKPAQ